MNWQSTENGFIRVNEDGSVDVHPHKYLGHGPFTLKATHDPRTGQCTNIEPIQTDSYVIVDAQTREIKFFSGVGFELRLAVGEPIPVPEGCEIIFLKAQDACAHCGSPKLFGRHDIIPPDFEQDVEVEVIEQDESGKELKREKKQGRRIAYKFENGFIKKSAAALTQPVVIRKQVAAP